MAELLFEIGTEEIPAGYLQPALEGMQRLAEAALKENRIEITGGFETYGTPRRLVLIGRDVSENQEDLVQEITGPPRSVAYDGEGRPTKAALGFAQKQGVSVEDLGCIETPKGEYLFVKRNVPGRSTREILAQILPRLIADIPWPKSMRWGNVGFAFARPIHWVLALFEGEVIPFEIAGVRSGNMTRGHRFMAPEEKVVSGVEDYFRKIKGSFVLIDQHERESVVKEIVTQAAAGVGGIPASDPELVATVANLVEYPSAVCGSFEGRFLSLPDAVLITAMKEHQKYFAVYDKEGLAPHFVAVNNTVARDESVVRKGHERVLRARLADAEFFFKEDRKRPLGDRLEDLKGVIYQADLGTSYAKVKRFTSLAEYLSERVAGADHEYVKVAASLCKCDLVTEMVGEFPSLQGIMGEVYARMDGYPEEVCRAIREHYLPTRSGGELPVSAVGAVVGCADRMDTIGGIFAIGQEPTGSADPFALRRHALAILRIVEEREWDISLREFIGKALSILSEEIRFERQEVFNKVWDFFRERYRQLMLRAGYENDLIEAIISVDFDRVHGLRSRMDQLKKFSAESKEFPQLVLTFKRVSNILRKQETSFAVKPVLFKAPCESELWGAYESLSDDVGTFIEKGEYGRALDLLARLRNPVDAFFDGVEVMTREDQALRENRIGILQHVAGLFRKVADFSKFSL